jgi:hypothetical protein
MATNKATLATGTTQGDQDLRRRNGPAVSNGAIAATPVDVVDDKKLQKVGACLFTSTPIPIPWTTVLT